MENVIVTPNRFRPENKLGEQTFLHSHTIVYTKIIEINKEVRDMMMSMKKDQNDLK